MKNKPLPFFLIALAVLVLDQFTKHLIKTHVGPFDTIRVLPFFNIVYAENIGAAFSMFKSLGNAFFITVKVLAIVVVSVLIFKDREHRLVFSLVLGGTAGNLADRIVHGYVIDFLDVYAGKYHWPAFNIADSALTIGIILLIFTTFTGQKGKVEG
ncbi:MAG TPA: signal peptidase II [Dissulfurispiraceae bacterium]